jgi:glycine oxidase
MLTGQTREAPGRAEVLVIGGGIIGLSIARALRQKDVEQVCVLEKNDFGREASWAAGGILAPQVEADHDDDFFQLARASRDLYPDFVQAVQHESGIDVGFDTTGTIYVAFTEKEAHEFRSRFEWQLSRGLSVEWLTGDEAREHEPAISRHVRCALRFPYDYQVENRRLVEALRIANERAGVLLVPACAAFALRIEKGRVLGVETDHGFIAASWVVLAAGSWSSSIRSTAPLPNINVTPIRGQMLCFKPETPLARHVIYSSRGYLIPRSDGRLLAGSTTEDTGFDKRVTEAGISTIRTMAEEIAPALESVPVLEAWAGFRPRAKDGLPVLGPLAGIKGLIYATGHYRNGILLAPVTAKLIAEAILSGATPPLLSPFLPERFA